MLPLKRCDAALYEQAWQWARHSPDVYGGIVGFDDLAVFIAHGSSDGVADFGVFAGGEPQALATFELLDSQDAVFHLITSPRANRRTLFGGLNQLERDFFHATGRTEFYATLPDEPQFLPVRRFARAWGLELQNDQVTFIRYVQRQ